MEFFLFAIFLIFVISLLGPTNPATGGRPFIKGVEPCPPHKWTYIKVIDPIDRSERERMICDKCKNPPGIG